MVSNTEQLIYHLIKKGQQTGEIENRMDAKNLVQSIHNSFIGLRVLSKTKKNKEDIENIIKTTLSIL